MRPPAGCARRPAGGEGIAAAQAARAEGEAQGSAQGRLGGALVGKAQAGPQGERPGRREGGAGGEEMGQPRVPQPLGAELVGGVRIQQRQRRKRTFAGVPARAQRTRRNSGVSGNLPVPGPARFPPGCGPPAPAPPSPRRSPGPRGRSRRPGIGVHAESPDARPGCAPRPPGRPRARPRARRRPPCRCGRVRCAGRRKSPAA